MITIVCVDDRGGMMFNRRRQSQDRVLREQLCALARESGLWMNAYSRKQFADSDEGIRTDEAFLEKAGKGEYCFVENQSLKPFEETIEQVILYRWNRAYPADQHLDLDLAKWKLVQTEEFAGYSHEKITKETYIRSTTHHLKVMGL